MATAATAGALLPITAIAAVTDDALFVACGRRVEAYRQGRRVESFDAFHDQAIHGLALSPLSHHPLQASPLDDSNVYNKEDVILLLIYGGASVCAACVNGPAHPRPLALRSISTSHHAGDWLLHASFQPRSPPAAPRALLLTAHNRLLLLSLVKADDSSSR